MLLSLKLRLDREAMAARPGDGSSLVSADCTLRIAQGQMLVSGEINKTRSSVDKDKP